MSISIVQALGGQTGTSVNSLQSSALGSAVTTGNTVLVGISYNLALADTISVSDTEGNTYNVAYGNAYVLGSSSPETQATQNTNTPGNTTAGVVFWAPNLTGGASFKIIVKAGSSTNFNHLTFGAIEVSGLGASPTIDVQQAGDGVSSPSSITTGTFTTAEADELVLVLAAATMTSTSGGISTPSGYTNVWEVTSASDSAAGNFSYLNASSIQSGVNPSFACTHTSLGTAFAVSFEAAGPPGTPTNLTVSTDARNPRTVLNLGV